MKPLVFAMLLPFAAVGAWTVGYNLVPAILWAKNFAACSPSSGTAAPSSTGKP